MTEHGGCGKACVRVGGGESSPQADHAPSQEAGGTRAEHTTLRARGDRVWQGWKAMRWLCDQTSLVVLHGCCESSKLGTMRCETSVPKCARWHKVLGHKVQPRRNVMACCTTSPIPSSSLLIASCHKSGFVSDGAIFGHIVVQAHCRARAGAGAVGQMMVVVVGGGEGCIVLQVEVVSRERRGGNGAPGEEGAQ